MQKVHKIIISLIICGLFFNLLPFHLFADSATYENINSGDCTIVEYRVSDSRPTKYSFFGSDLRGINIIRIDNGFNAYIISTSTFGISTSVDGNGACPVNAWSNAFTTVVNNITYYYWSISGNGTTYRHNEWPSINIENNNALTTAIKYTFGSGAVSPEPPLVFGDLKNLGFYTKFVNSQQNQVSQMALNKDVISWDKFQDSNGNDLNNINYRVDIQVATVDYEASSEANLISQTISDMLTGTWSDLLTISPNVGEVSFTWDEVAKSLFGTNNVTVNFWNNLFNVYDSARGVFFKKGWIYRIRLRTYDNTYVGDWQIIYNVTSASPSDSEKVYTNYYIYNYTTPNPDTYDVLQNINNINNTENNWYINDTPFDPDSNNSNWLDKLLEFLISLVDRIISFFTNLLDGLLDLILGLFGDVNPAESFFNWFSDLFNGIGDIDLTLPQFNLPEGDLTSFSPLVQETLNIFTNNNLSFIIWVGLLILIVRAVF